MPNRFARLFILLPLAACAAGQGSGNWIVQVPLTDAADPWHAQMLALDRCHAQGYQEAYPVRRPACTDGATDCQASHVASYECVGMGYQPL